MRITSYITVSGERTLTRVLQPNMARLADVSPDGKSDETLARRALDGVPGVTLSSADGRQEYAFALQAIDYAHDLLDQLSDKGDNSKTASCVADRQCVRKMDGGKCAYARLDVKWCTDHIRARVEGDNPLGLVGRVDQEVRETCVFWAYVVLLIKRNLNGGGRIEVVEGRHAEGVVADAARHIEEGDLWHKGLTCERRKGGYCTPSDPTCGNYDCGRCKWRSER